METVVHSLNYSLGFLLEQIADVPDENMSAQPNGVVNHPLWTIGHLTFVLHMIGGVVGVRQSLPDDFVGQFGPGSAPVNDRTCYGSRESLIAKLREAQSRVTEAITHLKDRELDERFPDPAYREVFPTIRHALTQVLVGHTAFHVGQVSVWRKAMGYPAMKRSYE